MSLSTETIVALASLFVSASSVGIALMMFDVQRKEARIDNFVTRYITLKHKNPNRTEDVHGLMTMLDAGILWLQSNDEIREAMGRLDDCRVLHPFNSNDLESDLLHFFKTANKDRANLGEMWGIIIAKVKAKESEMPPI